MTRKKDVFGLGAYYIINSGANNHLVAIGGPKESKIQYDYNIEYGTYNIFQDFVLCTIHMSKNKESVPTMFPYNQDHLPGVVAIS